MNVLHGWTLHIPFCQSATQKLNFINCFYRIDFKIRTIELDGKRIKLQILWGACVCYHHPLCLLIEGLNLRASFLVAAQLPLFGRRFRFCTTHLSTWGDELRVFHFHCFWLLPYLLKIPIRFEVMLLKRDCGFKWCPVSMQPTIEVQWGFCLFMMSQTNHPSTVSTHISILTFCTPSFANFDWSMQYIDIAATQLVV